MKPLHLDDLIGLEDYEAVRDDYRSRILAHKEDRRLALGDRVTLVFEDRETLRYQVLEMARIEGLRGPEKLQQELDAYNDLMPGEAEWSATLFIEIPDLSKVRRELDRLIGLDEHVHLVIGSAESEELAIQARFDSNQMEEDRISAVHYIRFALAGDGAARIAAGEPVGVRIAHPEYRCESALPQAMRQSLLRDLQDATPALLAGCTRSEIQAPRSEVLFEENGVRVLRPARPLAPEHVVVEPVGATKEFTQLPAEDLAPLLAEVQRLAAALTQSHGSCRIWLDVGGDTDPTPRFHLTANRN